MMELLIPEAMGDYSHFASFRSKIDWMALTRSRASVLRRVARRHERRLGDLFNADQVTEAQFREAIELEERLAIFIETGLRPDGLTQVA